MQQQRPTARQGLGAGHGARLRDDEVGDAHHAGHILHPAPDPESPIRRVSPAKLRREPPDRQRHPDYRPAVPADPSMPRQERGLRPARPLKYAPRVDGSADPKAGTLTLTFASGGSRRSLAASSASR